MRRKLIVALLLAIAVFTGLFGYYVVLPFRVVGKIGDRYRQTVRGMSKSEVLQLMKSCEAYRKERELVPMGLYWDDEVIEPAERSPAKSGIWYTVGTFYLPISHTFFFDDQDRLIGRHRFD